MSGPDLKFLAARASALEDRTTERLTDVHARIEEARRRRRVGVAVGVACAAVAIVLGLVLAQTHPSRTAPSPAPAPAPQTAPKVGTCWAVAPIADDAAEDPDNWYDDSPQVPCTEPHNAETVTTYGLDEPTPAEATKVEDDCANSVGSYVGLVDSWIPWSLGLTLPSREKIDKGASWALCVAVIPKDLGSGPDRQNMQTVTRSVEGLAADPPVEFLGCTADAPVSLAQERVPCAQPHAYEQTGFVIDIQAQRYPTAEERVASAQEQCSPDVPPDLVGMSVTAVWDTRADFHPWAPVFGVCFMFKSDGSLLPGK